MPLFLGHPKPEDLQRRSRTFFSRCMISHQQNSPITSHGATMKTITTGLLLVLLILALPAGAQFKDQGLTIGLAGGPASAPCEGTRDKIGFLGRGFIRTPLISDYILGEFGFGVG